MSALMDEYEQQYAGLTAEITSKISLLANQFVGDRKKIIADIDKHMEETQELLEQMELEVRSVESSIRPRYAMRLDSYRTELGRLKDEFVKVKNPQQPDNASALDEYYVEGVSLQDEQKQRLLNNSEKLERSGNQLKAGYRLVLETEEIGANILQDLQSQRETIERSRSRLREADADLNRSSKSMSAMISQSMQNKSLLIALIFLCLTALTLVLYFCS